MHGREEMITLPPSRGCMTKWSNTQDSRRAEKEEAEKDNMEETSPMLSLFIRYFNKINRKGKTQSQAHMGKPGTQCDITVTGMAMWNITAQNQTCWRLSIQVKIEKWDYPRIMMSEE